MRITTLGYIEDNGKFLMLHRTKKENDISQNKWLGIGGKVEEGETISECMKRETLEETGLVWHDPRLAGIVTFNYRPSQNGPLLCEQMFLYTGGRFEGTLTDCQEGDLEWVPQEDIPGLPLWKGDLIFLDLLIKGAPFFELKLEYTGDHLDQAVLDGRILDIESI